MYPTWINFLPGIAALVAVVIATVGANVVHHMIEQRHAKNGHY